MIHLSSCKMLKDSAIVITTIRCFLHHKKIGDHISINSPSIQFPKSRSNLLLKSFKDGKNYVLDHSEVIVSDSIKNHHSGGKRKIPLWNKFLRSGKFKSVILLNVITVVYASNIAIIKEVETFSDPACFSAVRFSLSTIPFLPFIYRARNDVETRNSGLELGIWISLGYLTEAFGLLSTDAGRASFISLFTVIVIPLLESLFGATVPARTWFGILMSGLGISMLECSGSTPNIGDLFNFLSAIFFGIHTLRTEHISRTTRKDKFMALLGYQVVVVAALSTIWCLIGTNLNGNPDRIAWSWALFLDWFFAFPWIPALYTGVFSTGLCLWGEIAAMRDVSAIETAVIYGLEPLWGAGFAWFLLGERWGIAGWIGAALILGGSLTVQMFGAASASTESGGKNKSKQGEDVAIVSDRRELKKTLTTSPVMVSSRQDVMDRLKK